MYKARFVNTIQELAGMSNKKENTIPATMHTTDTAEDVATTCPNVLQTRMAVSGGKMIRLEMSREPTSRIPMTMVTAVRHAITIL